MAKGFYVTIKRGARTGWLAGPFPTEPEARATIPQARDIAYDIDPRSHWDLFGTAKLEAPNLPPGSLNKKIGM